jgi:hypothetical protein
LPAVQDVTLELDMLLRANEDSFPSPVS